jgi:hypothetical protein
LPVLLLKVPTRRLVGHGQAPRARDKSGVPHAAAIQTRAPIGARQDSRPNQTAPPPVLVLTETLRTNRIEVGLGIGTFRSRPCNSRETVREPFYTALVRAPGSAGEPHPSSISRRFV